jgi:hypothetical protein
MEAVTATFSIPDWLEDGLRNNTYERYGGVIRDSRTKSIVAMLRETTPDIPETGKILSQFGSVASILDLAVSTIGFTIVIHKLDKIENQLNIIQKDIQDANHKLDLSVYSNFRASLDLARYAFTIKKSETRDNQVNLAIKGFLDAKHSYADYFERALEGNLQVADEYLKSLFLSHVAIARCYLELEEVDTGLLCLQEGAEFLSRNVKKFIGVAFQYLDQEEKEKFYKSYTILVPPTYLTINNVISGVIGRWTTLKPKIEPFFLGASLVQIKPINIVEPILPGILNLLIPIAPVAVVPLTMLAVGELVKTFVEEKPEEKTKPELTQLLEKIETMIEVHHRFEAYQAEVQALSQLDISFKDWLKIIPSSEVQIEQSKLLYIMPSTPLEVKIFNHSIFEYE